MIYPPTKPATPACDFWPNPPPNRWKTLQSLPSASSNHNVFPFLCARRVGLAPPSSTIDNHSMAVTESQDLQTARYLSEAYQQLQEELSKVIVGQNRVIEE